MAFVKPLAGQLREHDWPPVEPDSAICDIAQILRRQADRIEGYWRGDPQITADVQNLMRIIGCLITPRETDRRTPEEVADSVLVYDDMPAPLKGALWHDIVTVLRAERAA